MFFLIGWKKLGTALLAAFLFALSSFAVAQDDAAESAAPHLSPEAEAQYKGALEKFNHSDITGALSDLEQMAAADPKMIPPRLIMAQWFAQLKNPNAVRLCLEKAVIETPEDPEAYILLAENALRQGEWMAAELLLGKAGGLLGVEREWANSERKQNLTVTYLKNLTVLNQAREDWNGMQKSLGALWKLGEKTSETCKLIGISYFHLGNPEKAGQWFAQAYNISPKTEFTPDVMMARLYLAEGDREHAQESLNSALKADPDSPAVLNLSLVTALNNGDMGQVKGLAQRLYAVNPRDPASLKTCGTAALYLEDYPKAESLFLEGLRLQPANTEIENGLALALAEQNDPEKCRLAVQHAVSNLQKQKNNPEYLATLGWTLYKSGDTDQALSVLQQTAADGQLHSQTAYYLADVLNSKGGEEENVKKLLTAALEGNAPFPKRNAAEKLLKQLK